MENKKLTELLNELNKEIEKMNEEEIDQNSELRKLIEITGLGTIYKVYKITINFNGENNIYFGMSKNPDERIRSAFSEKTGNTGFNKFIKENNIDSIKFEKLRGKIEIISIHNTFSGARKKESELIERNEENKNINLLNIRR